jgi:hypothetical protein
VDILNQRHAFDLPSQAVCDALVDVFFRWIAPVLPVISRHDFMRRYRNPQDPPSILLLQAVLMVASRFHYNAQSSGNGVISPRIFYKKVKALYDAGYERDPTTVLQAVVLLGVYWDGPDGRVLPRALICIFLLTSYRSHGKWDILLESFGNSFGPGTRASPEVKVTRYHTLEIYFQLSLQ